MREQRIVLEDHADAAFFRLQKCFIVEQSFVLDDEASVFRPLQPGKQAQNRAFSAAAAAEDRNDLTFFDF